MNIERTRERRLKRERKKYNIIERHPKTGNRFEAIVAQCLDIEILFHRITQNEQIQHHLLPLDFRVY